MSDSFYSDPELYDLMFPPGAHARFYADEARRAGGPVLELACGTGQLLLPISGSGLRAVGLDLSTEMLRVARERLSSTATPAVLVEGDMRDFALDEQFALAFIARNSLLHLHRTDDLLACFRSVRRHLAPGGMFLLDIFNPSVSILARPAGQRFPVMRLQHPVHGEITVEADGSYDAAAQVTREVWHFSTAEARDFRSVPLAVRSIFPQELPLLLAAGGFRLEARYGTFTREPFESASARQICVCSAA